MSPSSRGRGSKLRPLSAAARSPRWIESPSSRGRGSKLQEPGADRRAHLRRCRPLHGGVDRNMPLPGHVPAAPRARRPLHGGVDRNNVCRPPRRCAQSAPVALFTGAWIETPSDSLGQDDLERWRSPSSRGRGSKHTEAVQLRDPRLADQVALFTGAWIETSTGIRSTDRADGTGVALFTGAWIETAPRQRPGGRHRGVALFTGAWIETPEVRDLPTSPA